MCDFLLQSCWDSTTYCIYAFLFIVAKPKPVSAAVRRKRMNFRLRKVLTPKSPLMVLNEIVGGVNYTFVDTPSTMLTPGIPHLFTAQCEVTIYLCKNLLCLTLRDFLLPVTTYFFGLLQYFSSFRTKVWKFSPLLSTFISKCWQKWAKFSNFRSKAGKILQ